MGDLDLATRVEQTGASSYAAVLSPDWEIWGPNGGYIASVALRAAGMATQRARPASITAHFLGVAASREVQIEVTINRATKVASSATVHITQDDRPVLTAIVWGTDADLPGLTHQIEAPTTALAAPDGLPTIGELMTDHVPPPHPFWQNLDQRPIDWIVDWDNRAPGLPTHQSWYRFVPSSIFDDPWVDAMRSLILLDLDSWSSATMPHVGELDYYAPTIEVNARFAAGNAGPWLLSVAAAPAASDGLVVASGEIWTHDGRLAAIGGSTLLCRPAARRPDR